MAAQCSRIPPSFGFQCTIYHFFRAFLDFLSFGEDVDPRLGAMVNKEDDHEACRAPERARARVARLEVVPWLDFLLSSWIKILAL